MLTIAGMWWQIFLNMFGTSTQKPVRFYVSQVLCPEFSLRYP
jgi:hypothetical protein